MTKELWNPFLIELIKDLTDFVGQAKLVRSLDREDAQELLLRSKTALDEIERITALEDHIFSK